MGYDYAKDLFSSRDEPNPKGGYDYAKELFSSSDVSAPDLYPGGTVGGTYRKTGEISTITGKGMEEFVPGSSPEAGFDTLLGTSFVDDPYTKAKVFAKARKLPITRYRVNKEDKVEFRNDEGKWQREVSELPGSKAKSFAADVAGHPSTYLGTAGAALGVPGAVGGAMVGELARKGIAKYGYGEDPSLGKTLYDTAMQGIFGLSGEIGGKAISAGVNKFLGRGVGAVKKAGTEIRQGLLTSQEHAQAMYIKSLADKFGITLAPHQLYDKKGMTNVWKYLRNHPVTADEVQKFERNLTKSSEKGMDDFIREMGGFERGPFAVGEELQEAATGAIRGAEKRVSERVKPAYDAAFSKAEPVDLVPVMEILEERIKTWPDVKGKKILEGFKKSLTEEVEREIPGTPGTIVEKMVQPKRTLLGWIREKGGLNVKEYHDWERAESGVVALSNKKRRGVDEIMSEAASEGWLTPGVSEKQFVEMLQRDIRAAKSGGQRVLKIDEMRASEMVSQGEIPSKTIKERIPINDLRKLQKVVFELNDWIDNVHPEAQQMAPSSKKFIETELEGLKKDMLVAAKVSSPEFIEANKLYESLLPPVKKLKQSVLGELTRMRSEKELAKSHGKLFDVQNMPDAELLRYAKDKIGSENPKLWRELVGQHVRDIWEGLKRTEEGELLNAAGKMQKRMFGSTKQREIWQAALSSDDYARLSDLMEVFQHAAVGTGKESMTASLLAVEKEITGQMGSNVYKMAKEPRQTLADWAFGKWDEAVMSGRQGKLMEALQDADVLERIQKMKKLTPGSKKLIEEFSVLGALMAEKTRRETP